jgi:hypothetical protein
MLLALGYVFTAAIVSISALGLARIPLLFVGMALCVRNGDAMTGILPEPVIVPGEFEVAAWSTPKGTTAYSGEAAPEDHCGSG